MKQQYDARAQLIIVCTGEGRHKELLIRHLLLDTVTPLGVLFDIVTVPTGPQRGGQADPNAYAGEHDRWRFWCRQPGCPDLPASKEGLQDVMEKIADTPERVLRTELRPLARAYNLARAHDRLLRSTSSKMAPPLLDGECQR